jgi:Polyketide cyclase / dehydrase and lipid transport
MGGDGQTGAAQIGGRVMNEFEVVTVIGCPVGEVFSAVQDVAKTPLWNPGLLQVRRTSEGPLGVGATMVYVGTFLGRRYESPVACTGFAENKQFATATTGGPFHLEVDQVLEPAGAGTKLVIHCRADSRGFFRLAEPLVIRLTKRQAETAAGNLKTLLEEHAL